MHPRKPIMDVLYLPYTHSRSCTSCKRSSDMQVAYLPDGLEAIIFTADGDMRQALNNLQVK